MDYTRETNYKMKAADLWNIRDAAIEDILSSGQEMIRETQAQYLDALAELATLYEEMVEMTDYDYEDWTQETQDLRHGG